MFSQLIIPFSLQWHIYLSLLTLFLFLLFSYTPPPPPNNRIFYRAENWGYHNPYPLNRRNPFDFFPRLFFLQVLEFFQQLNVAVCCRATLYNMQSLYVNTAIYSFWSRMQSSLLERLQRSGQPIAVTGDGQYDSPGFSARYCFYTLVEASSKLVLDFYVAEKTQASKALLDFRNPRTVFLWKVWKSGARDGPANTIRHNPPPPVFKSFFSRETCYVFTDIFSKIFKQVA